MAKHVWRFELHQRRVIPAFAHLPVRNKCGDSRGAAWSRKTFAPSFPRRRESSGFVGVRRNATGFPRVFEQSRERRIWSELRYDARRKNSECHVAQTACEALSCAASRSKAQQTLRLVSDKCIGASSRPRLQGVSADQNAKHLHWQLSRFARLCQSHCRIHCCMPSPL